MRKINYFFPILVVSILCFGFMYYSVNDPNSDSSPSLNSEVTPAYQGDTMPPAGFPFVTLFNFNYQFIGGMNGGTVGALFLNNRYYFNRWNSTEFYRYNNAGPGGGPGAIVDSGVYTGSIRDMCTDGRYIYGGKSTTQSGVLYKFDTATLSQLTTFSIAGQDIRAIAYDPNRRGFWCTGFSGNLVCHDSTGATLATITSSLTGKYGMAWDSTLSQDTAWVWAWNQESSGTQNGLYKYYAANGTLKATYLFNLPGASIGISGGANITTMVVGSVNELVLLLNYQNFALVGYKMKDILTYLEQTNTQVRNFSLGQNYPNPFNPTTKISFTLTKAGDVSLDVYNVLGVKVASLINGYMNAGEHKLNFDGNNLASGTYFYKISSNGYTETKKMLLIK